MKLSSKGRYAVRIMAELAKANGECLSAAELGERQDISTKYLEKITCLLSKAGLINAVMGTHGGYKLSRTPDKYTLADILKVTDDLPRLAPCLCGEKDCSRAKTCLSISCWEKLDMVIVNFLKSVTLEDLLDKKI